MSGAAQSDREASFLLRSRAAAARQRVDRVTAEVCGAMGAVGLEAILLKGPTIARWLYPADTRRDYWDTDLLVDPRRTAAARACLIALGFSRVADDSDMSAIPAASEAWFRAGDGAMVDLHSTLVGAAAGREALWLVLSAASEPFEVEGVVVRSLTPPARLLHIALHAAQHGAAAGKPSRDLALAVDQIEMENWREAAALADDLEAAAAMAAGLRLLPEGARLAGDLGLPTARPPTVSLLVDNAPPGAMTIEALSRSSGARARVRLVVRKTIPPPRYMRAWIASEGGPRGGLLLAYLYRPIWLLLKAGPALGAWRRARSRA